MNSYLYLLPLFAIIVHNAEEALWLPRWSKYAKKFHKEVKQHEFLFAVLMITAFAVIITAGISFYPNNRFAKFVYFGFFGMMIFNAFFPHLISTIVLKKYAPGTITAFMLNVPINLFIIIKAINANIITIPTIIISTISIGIITLSSLPILFKLSKIIEDYQ